MLPHLFPILPVPSATPIVFMALGLLFFAALVAKRLTTPRGEAGARTDRGSAIGIALQALGFVAVAGPAHTAGGLSMEGWASPRTLVVAACAAGAALLFQWAARTMGRNWSLVARVREDHQLVTSGPFAWVRHPIYAAMALFLIAWALSSGREYYLIVGLPIFIAGTLIRTRREEALLRGQFGAQYDAYAARVKRFVPGLF